MSEETQLAELIPSDVEKINELEKLILQTPQIDLKTSHSLSGGMYARTIYIPAGTVLTGATHKTDHINIVFGDISVSTDEGMKRLTGHHVIETKAGMKRAGFAHEYTVWTTICKTDLTDIKEIEKELVIESEMLQTNTLSVSVNKPNEIEAK